jgi:arabinofuranan 3-O-arabinosyltransferase
LLPFSVAWILFDVISLTLFILVMAPLTHQIPSGLTIVLAAPVVLLTLAIGNNSLLTSACMTAAIIALGVGRQRSAGLLIALMTLKPSLGLLVPVVLIAARQWRAIAWATVGTVVLAAIGAAIFGTNYWLRFFDQLGNASAMLASGSLPFERMITWYAFLRVAGLAHDLALIGQLAVTALVMFAVGALWARRSGQFDLRAAAFCFGLPLATPYAFYYELVFSLAGILFLLRARSAWPGAVWCLFAMLWTTPGLGLFAASVVPVALLGAPLQTIALGITLWHGFRASADRDAVIP